MSCPVAHAQVPNIAILVVNGLGSEHHHHVCLKFNRRIRCLREYHSAILLHVNRQLREHELTHASCHHPFADFSGVERCRRHGIGHSVVAISSWRVPGFRGELDAHPSRHRHHAGRARAGSHHTGWLTIDFHRAHHALFGHVPQGR